MNFDSASTLELRTIFDSSLDGIMLTTPEGSILAANPAACRMLGRDEADLCRVGRAGMVDETDPRLAPALATRRLTGSFMGELTFLRRNGERFPVEVSTAVFSSENGALHTTMIFRDITDRKRADEALRTSQEKFAKAFHTTPDGVTITRRSDGRYLEVNEGFAVLSGYQPQEVVGRTSLELGVWVYPEQRQTFVQTLTDHGEVLNFEALFRFRNAVLKTCLVSARELDIQGVPCILSSTRDISQRKVSEDLLTQEKERLAVTLASMADGMIATDAEALVVLMNPAACQMVGWPAEEAVGRPLVEFWRTLHESTRAWGGDPIRAVLDNGTPLELPPHTCLVARDGRERLIEGVSTPIRDEVRITGAVLVFRDLTEKLRAAESLARMQKLESIGTLAGGIAHDFNNMLGGLFGFLELARESFARGKLEKIPHYIDRALGIYDRARGLTHQLLTFSKGGTPVRKVVSLVPVIKTSVGFALGGSGVTCQFDLADDLWPCNCDENQVGQVLDNLVINASQSMPGGNLFVSAENVVDPPGHPGLFVRIQVTDSGAGILPENLSRIFDPFFSTKDSGQGLGLSAVFSIVRRHDGWVDVQSIPGAGATFGVYLPALPLGSERPSDPAGLDHRGQGSILVMDDEEALLEVAVGLLESMGYQVTCCANSTTALEAYWAAQTRGVPFVALILDLTIPGDVGGAAVAKAIRSSDHVTPLVAASGYSEDQVFSRLGEFGFSGRIAKPFLKKDLAALLDGLMPAKPLG